MLCCGTVLDVEMSMKQIYLMQWYDKVSLSFFLISLTKYTVFCCPKTIYMEASLTRVVKVVVGLNPARHFGFFHVRKLSSL